MDYPTIAFLAVGAPATDFAMLFGPLAPCAVPVGFTASSSGFAPIGLTLAFTKAAAVSGGGGGSGSGYTPRGLTLIFTRTV